MGGLFDTYEYLWVGLLSLTSQLSLNSSNLQSLLSCTYISSVEQLSSGWNSLLSSCMHACMQSKTQSVSQPWEQRLPLGPATGDQPSLTLLWAG